MDFKDIWNDICYYKAHKSQKDSERDFQTVAESFFAKLGWLAYKGEIITQQSIQVGSSNSVKPDIIIKPYDEQPIFVVELKKQNITISERNVEQLISYMRLLKVKFGILLGDNLQVYYDLPNDNRPPSKVNEISFIEDSSEGINFIKLLSKNEYSCKKLQRYCEDILVNQEKYENFQKYINLLCSDKGTEIIINLIKEKFSSEYSEEIITDIMNEISINISRKKIIPPLSALSINHHQKPQTTHSSKTLTRHDAEMLCKEDGLNLNGEITFAAKNKSYNKYWANPRNNFLAYNWWLLLNDNINHKLHIFNISANSINVNQIKVRSDKPSLIDLQIKYDDDLFEDTRSGIQFIKWLIKTIYY
jgi:hypothetical protein